MCFGFHGEDVVLYAASTFQSMELVAIYQLHLLYLQIFREVFINYKTQFGNFDIGKELYGF